MKRWYLVLAMALLVVAGGCARLRKKPRTVVLPSGARMPPLTAPAPARTPAVQTAPAPSTAPAVRIAPAPAPAPVVQAAPMSAVQTTAAQQVPPPAPPPAEPRRSWWRKKPREARVPFIAAPAPQRPGRVYRMKPGDPIVIVLRGIPGYAGGQQNIEGVLDENGSINLPFLNFLEAAGKTTSELEREIMRRYIEGGFYRTLGVNIILPTQSYFVRGEVRGPGRFPLTGGATILQALATAGGFTEYANSRRVELLRGGQRIVVNVRELEKYPARDKELEAGDVLIVPRSAF